MMELIEYLSCTYPKTSAVGNPIRVERIGDQLKVFALDLWGEGGVESPACLGRESELMHLSFLAMQDISLKDYPWLPQPSERQSALLSELLLAC